MHRPDLHGQTPYLVSQIVQGDRKKQSAFAHEIGTENTCHIQLNHNVKWKGIDDRDQRARSLVFFAYGVLVATALQSYVDGATIPLYACENGFISINPPLTEARLGSLSTRTTHPRYVAALQQLFDSANLRVQIKNPYQFKTKGEMFSECADQSYLIKNAHLSTSCSRFRRFGFQHCGRCVPCLVRRAAFLRWGHSDKTAYQYELLGKANREHSGHDDVRSTAIALQVLEEEGIEHLLGASLSTASIDDRGPYHEVVSRGLAELKTLLSKLGVK